MAIPIRERVHRCAQELTAEGATPFTRQDLIARLQRDDPNINPDSVNPIIQSMTVNLQGGAPGAVGKDLLHSVARGKFVLRAPPGPRVVDAGVTPPGPAAQPPVEVDARTGQRQSQLIGDWQFDFVVQILPQRGPAGEIVEHLPQDRYENRDGLPLHKYGTGPFCKFSIPRTQPRSGVYIISVDDEARYVGESEDLASRFNTGYGNISPRNCFAGGQDTNCRINHLILQSATDGRKIELWFHESEHFKQIERCLRDDYNFDWNRV
jgi:hypothetical protein